MNQSNLTFKYSQIIIWQFQLIVFLKNLSKITTIVMFVIEVLLKTIKTAAIFILILLLIFFIPATDRRQPGSVVSVGSVSPVSGSNRIHMYDQRPAPRQADRCRRGRVRLCPDHPVSQRGSGVRGQKGTPESGFRLLGHQHCR